MTSEEIITMITYPGWWDGPDRYSTINRNIIGVIQRERDYKWAMALQPNGNGLEIGGAGFKDRGCVGVSPDIENDADLKIDGRTLEGIKDESVDYILSSHTFEHINQNPVLILKRWFEVLKNNGLILTIMPDKNYFKHNENETREFLSAPNKMTPADMKKCLDELSGFYDFETVLIDTHKNNFDFDTVLRKK